MKRGAAIFALALVAGAGAGVATTRPLPVEEQPRVADVRLVHAGSEAAEARQRLEALGFDAAAPEEALEAPPPLDIAFLFRRDLTAIERRPDGLQVWIVDFYADNGRRALRVGDIYQDGWRVSGISPQTIELRRRRETRVISAFAPAPNPEFVTP